MVFRSANTSKLHEDDQTEFHAIREQFDSFLTKVNRYCLDYAPMYTFIQDNLELFSPLDLQEFLVRRDFDRVVVSATNIADCAYELCNKIQSFLNKLYGRYSRACLITWGFVGNLVCGIVAIAIAIQVSSSPGAGPVVATGLTLIDFSCFLKLLVDYKIYSENVQFDKSLKVIKSHLKTCKAELSGFEKVSRTHSGKVRIVQMALGTDNPSGMGSLAKVKDYTREMCTSFRALEQALSSAITNTPKQQDALITLSHISCATGVAVASCGVTRAVAAEPGKIAEYIVNAWFYMFM
jgi:hypothetical protein